MCCSGGNYKHIRRNAKGGVGSASVNSKSDKVMSVVSILILVVVVVASFYFFK